MDWYSSFRNYNANEWVTGAKENVWDVSFNIPNVLLLTCEGMTIFFLNPAVKVSTARLTGRRQQLLNTALQRDQGTWNPGGLPRRKQTLTTIIVFQNLQHLPVSKFIITSAKNILDTVAPKIWQIKIIIFFQLWQQLFGCAELNWIYFFFSHEKTRTNRVLPDMFFYFSCFVEFTSSQPKVTDHV